MAVTIESVGTAGWSGVDSGNTLTVTKPTGLAVGDLMVAHIAVNDEDSNSGAVTRSGWTSLGSQIRSDANGMAGTQVFYKIADSGDVSASDFAFTNATAEGMGMAGAIYRISGWGASPTMASADAGATTTPTFTNTITPTVANSLLLFLYSGTDSGVASAVSNYAITTSNPSWTEKYDQSGDLGAYFGAGNGSSPLMSGASATRPETTATGDSSCTISNDFNYNVGSIVVIQPSVNATVTPTVMSVVASIQAPTMGITEFPTVISVTVSVQAPTVTVTANPWTNQSKNSSTWVNTSKS